MSEKYIARSSAIAARMLGGEMMVMSSVDSTFFTLNEVTTAFWQRSMESSAKSYEAERRSTRIRAQIPLRVTSLDPAIQFSEQCHTLVVNTEGCGVRLSRPLEPGVPVQLEELPGGRTATALVANCVPLGGKFWIVGLALDESGNIWGIHPAPANWGEQPKPVTPAAPVPLATQQDQWPYAQF